jgi:5-methyltetrahydrofolate--homocysteine methyltransferase
MHTVLSSPNKTVTIGHDQPFVIIGERINPTGRKLFQEKLRNDDLSTVNIDVADQVAGGADMLDVNMGVPLTDEPALLAKAIKLVQSLTDLPICIDSSVIEALDAGLAVYEGKALVNSMTGEDDRMDAILPLVKKYDAAILALPNDETGIPMTADERMPIVEKIVRRVEKEGISLENLLIDPLAMPVGAEPEAVKQTLETIYRVREKYGLNMSIGASNVSFGLPNRHALNASFMPMAM